MKTVIMQGKRVRVSDSSARLLVSKGRAAYAEVPDESPEMTNDPTQGRVTDPVHDPLESDAERDDGPKTRQLSADSKKGHETDHAPYGKGKASTPKGKQVYETRDMKAKK